MLHEHYYASFSPPENIFPVLAMYDKMGALVSLVHSL